MSYLEKECRKCGITKPENQFCKGKSKSGYLNTCKKCETLRCRIRRVTDTYDQARSKMLKYKYGLSSDVYASLLAGQYEKCRICPTKHTADKPLRVDHCHVTGNIRGLLCHSCNSGLGFFKDDPGLLEAAKQYLTKGKINA